MTKTARIWLLIGLPLVAFLGIGYYDASQREYHLQDLAQEGFAACNSLHPDDEAALRACMAPYSRQRVSAWRDALNGAVPGALIAAGTCLIVLALGLHLIGRRKGSGAD
jgi:hypothetical protein